MQIRFRWITEVILYPIEIRPRACSNGCLQEKEDVQPNANLFNQISYASNCVTDSF